jgi:hypothetical protein
LLADNMFLSINYPAVYLLGGTCCLLAIATVLYKRN